MGGKRDRGRAGGAWAARQGRKGNLSDDERQEALKLRARRFSPQAIALALGRSVEDVRAFLADREAADV